MTRDFEELEDKLKTSKPVKKLKLIKTLMILLITL